MKKTKKSIEFIQGAVSLSKIKLSQLRGGVNSQEDCGSYCTGGQCNGRNGCSNTAEEISVY